MKQRLLCFELALATQRLFHAPLAHSCFVLVCAARHIGARGRTAGGTLSKAQLAQQLKHKGTLLFRDERHHLVQAMVQPPDDGDAARVSPHKCGGAEAG